MLIERIKNNPRLRRFVLWTLAPEHHPRPRWWVRCFVTPFIHQWGKGVKICRHARMDIFPWKHFSIGDHSIVEDFAVVNNGAGDLLFGRNVLIGIGSVVVGPAVLEDGVGIGQHVSIQGLNHGYEAVGTNWDEQPLTLRPVRIGRNAHIGANTAIVAGVTIGEQSVIGAGSVVVKDIPPFCVAAGNPARIIKRYDPARKEWVRVKESL